MCRRRHRRGPCWWMRVRLRRNRSYLVLFWRQPAGISAITVLALVIGLTSAWLLKPIPEQPLRKFQWPVENLHPRLRPLAISPDGSMVAYVADNRLWIRDLDQTEPREIPDSEGASKLFWSPRSDELGYVAQNELRKVAATGGPSLTLHKASMFIRNAATWRPDGMIIISSGVDLFEVSAHSGNPVAILHPDSTIGEQELFAAHVLPDGKTLVFLVNLVVQDGEDTSTDLVVQDGETRRTLVRGNPGERLSGPVYAPSGHLLYNRIHGTPQDRNIWAIPFDLSSLTRTGDPFLVVEHAAGQSVSTDGTLVYSTIVATEGAQELVWVDRTGRIGDTIGQPQDRILSPAISPDGSIVAVEGTENGNRDIWIHNVVRGAKNRLTFHTCPCPTFCTTANRCPSEETSYIVMYAPSLPLTVQSCNMIPISSPENSWRGMPGLNRVPVCISATISRLSWTKNSSLPLGLHFGCIPPLKDTCHFPLPVGNSVT